MIRSSFLPTALLALLLAATQEVSGRSIFRRASSTVPPEKTLDMPLIFDSRGRYTLPVTMGGGSAQQVFNFTLTTGTGLTYVAAQGCSSCSNISLYDQAKSPSAVSLSGTDNTTFFGSSVSGSLIKENCGAKLSNGSFWAYPNQTVLAVNQQAANPVLSDGISGILGLGFNRPQNGSSQSSALGLQDAIFGQWFPRNPGHENFTFGMFLQPSGASAPSAGSNAGLLHWLQPDPQFFKPNQISWANAIGGVSDTTTGNGTTTSPAQDWTVGLDGWAATVGNTHLSNTQSVVATVDPMYPNVYLPGDQAKLIHDAINGSSPAPSGFSTLGAASQAFRIPCNSQFSFGFEVGSQTFVLNPDSLVIKLGDGTCVSGLEGLTDSSQTNYIVGARFISTIYLIFNIPQNGQSSIGFSPRVTPSKSSTNVGAIVGGTVGGVALVIVAGLIAFWYLRRRANRQRGPFEIDDPDKPVQHVGVDPYILGAPTPAQRSQITPPGSPVPSQPLLLDEEGGMHAAMPPPSYEEVSSTGSSTPIASRPQRDYKGRVRPRAVSSLTETTSTSTSAL